MFGDSVVCNESQKYDVSYEIGRKESLELVGSAPWTGNQQSPAMHGYGLHRFTSSLSVGEWYFQRETLGTRP